MTKLTIMLPDKIAKLVARRSDRDEFVSRVLAEALADESRPEQPSPSESKWSRLVRRIEAHPVTLGSYLEQERRDRARFREEMHFPHDDP